MQVEPQVIQTRLVELHGGEEQKHDELFDLAKHQLCEIKLRVLIVGVVTWELLSQSHILGFNRD